MEKNYTVNEMLVTIEDVCLFVKYEYDEGEPRVMYYSDFSGHPGSPPSVQVLEVYAGDVDVFNLLSNRQIENIEMEILESYE